MTLLEFFYKAVTDILSISQFRLICR